MKSVPIILYAEDDHDDLEMLQEALQSNRQAFHLIHLKNGKEVIDYLSGHPEELMKNGIIVLDINMPLVDGKETLEWIKQQSKLDSIPVVMLTTSEYSLDIKYCEDLNARVINKPQLFEELIAVAKEILDMCHPHSEV